MASRHSKSVSSSFSKLAPVGKTLRAIECPICLEVPFPPIFQCEVGHNICNNCKKTIHTCPTCQSPWTTSRNFAMEQIIFSSLYTCVYKESGCSVTRTGDSIETHVKNCEFRPTKCPYYKFPFCKLKTLRNSEVKDHLMGAHGCDHVDSNYFELSLEIRDETCLKVSECLKMGDTILDFDQNNFLINIVVFNGMFIWTILMIGQEEDAIKYKVEIQLQPQSAKGETWIIPVHGTANRTLKNFALKEAVFKPTLTWKRLKRLVRKTSGTFQCKFSIIK